jgi:hypothetical protein
MPLTASQRAGIERWFVRRGLPHFIHEYDARTDIWTRSLPFLVVAYVLLGLNALQLADWGIVKNLLALAGLLALLGLAIVLANVVQHRPAFSRPRRVGAPELAVFVLGPAVATAALGGQFADAAQTVVEGLVVLGVVYVATSYGLVPMTRWALGRVGGQLFAIFQLVAKALPLLTLLVVVAFLAAEPWQVAGLLTGPVYWIAIGVFPLIGTMFVVSRIPRDVADLARFEEPGTVTLLVAGTPAAPLTDHAALDAEQRPAEHLSRREWLNVGLVMLFSQGVQVTLVVLATFGLLVGLGLLMIDAATTEAWTGAAPNVLWSPALGGRELCLSEQLLRVAGFLAAFTGLNFTVYLVTDPTYRQEFREEVVAEVRQAFAVREVYLDALHGTGEVPSRG